MTEWKACPEPVEGRGVAQRSRCRPREGGDERIVKPPAFSGKEGSVPMRFPAVRAPGQQPVMRSKKIL